MMINCHNGLDSRWNGFLPEAWWSKLQEFAQTVEVPPGTIIQDAGEKLTDLKKVTDGHVKLMLVDETGDAETIEVIGKGAVFGECALARDKICQTRAVALDHVRLLSLPAAEIYKLLTADPENALSALAILSANLRRLLKQVTELKLKNTAQRLGMLLFSLADQSEGSTVIELPYRKQDVADKLAMTPETLSRSFAKLEKIGIHTEGHRIVKIDDLEELAEFCGIDLTELEEEA